MCKPTVQVLLSTYNGEQYIVEQIKSILNQNDVDVHLLVRDDGSKDRTVEIIGRLNDERIKVIPESNIGSTKSFIRLFSLSGEYDYYALSDQDDVWDNDKLSVGINKIKDFDVPSIYSANTRLVDSELKPLETIERTAKTDLGSAIIKNYVSGCTTVFNSKLMLLLKQYEPLDIPFHDWWANIVALSNGGISVYDSEPHMSYRQHGNNVVGAADSKIKIWKIRLRKFFGNNYRRDLMAKYILKFYGNNLSDENRKIITLVAEGKKHPLRMINSGYFHTNSKLDDLAFYVCAIFRKI